MMEPADQLESPEKSTPDKLPPLVMAACCWPFILIAVGGLIGGLAGGGACAANIAMYRSSLPRWSLWILNPLTGLLAFVVWIALAIVLELALSGSGET